MITSENLKNSEITEDIDYLDADEAFPDFPDDDDSFDDLEFSDDPKGEENTYVSMKDADNIDKQVTSRCSALFKNNIDPLKSANLKLEDESDKNAAAAEMQAQFLKTIEKNNENFSEELVEIKEKIETINSAPVDKQVEYVKEEAQKFVDGYQADAILLAKTQIEAFISQTLQIFEQKIDEKRAAADKEFEEKLEKIRLANLELQEREEKLLEEKKELKKEKEEIQQKIDEFDQKVEEFYRQQESKQVEIEEMVASLVEQNNDLRDNLENEKKEKLQLKIVIEEQNKTIAAQTEQSEKLIITIKEENDQKAQILREKEELFDVIQKKDERRNLEVKGYKDEIDNLRQAVARREEKMNFNNSILVYFISVVFIIWGLVGTSTTPEIQSWLKSFVSGISWTSIVIGGIVFCFKLYRDITK